MIFDRKLCFIDKKKIQDFAGGVLGDVLDLGAPDQLRGRQSYIAICCGDDTTATGDPAISFAMEFSNDEAFTDPVRVPLSLPPIKKADMAKGKAVIARSPIYSQRYVRLVMDTATPITCAEITAGFVLDADAA